MVAAASRVVATAMPVVAALGAQNQRRVQRGIVATRRGNADLESLGVVDSDLENLETLEVQAQSPIVTPVAPARPLK